MKYTNEEIQEAIEILKEIGTYMLCDRLQLLQTQEQVMEKRKALQTALTLLKDFQSGKVGYLAGEEEIKNSIRFHIEAIGATYGKDSLEPILDAIARALVGKVRKYEEL